MEKTNPSRWFNIVSWGITALIVTGLFGFAYLRRQNLPIVAAAPAAQSTAAPQATKASPAKQVPALEQPSILRKLTLKTTIPDRPRYTVINHTVQRGDSIFRISKLFNIKPETLLWANYEVLEDDPHSLKPGQELNIPPTDGLLYEWKDGDTIDKVASKYEATSDDIVNWPGNNFDLSKPNPKAGQLVMIPGGWRESKAITLPTILRGSGTGTAGVSSGACGGGGPSGGIAVWPTANHFVSGNDYYPGHLAIDLAAAEGSPVYAAGSGVVTVAAGGWNGGYGNYIMVDHGGGYATLYAHLSVINVSVCQGVYAGQTIGAAGNTGNSFGAHLHFEVRAGGSNVNPWYVLP